MFDDYWELIPRSQDSAGKSFVKSTYQRNSNYREVYSGGLKTSDAGASQKEAPGGARWAPRHTWAWPKVGPRPAMARPPGSTPQVALSRISPPGKPSSVGIVHEIFCRLHGTETIERERALWQGDPAGEIPSRRGEIIAIVIIITLDFIGIIITIIHYAITITSIDSTVILL